MSIDKEILNGFVEESKRVLMECVEILEKIEGDSSQAMGLMEYANRVDRVMGAARSLLMMNPEDTSLKLIGDCTALCKAMGYRGAKLSGNSALFDVTVAFLCDATEIIEDILESLTKENSPRREQLQKVFFERVKWITEVSSRIPAEGPSSSKALDQDEVEALLKKLGMG